VPDILLDDEQYLEELEEESEGAIVASPDELLTLKILKQAIQLENHDDPVMADFGEYVLPNLLKMAVGVTAKGGKFFDGIDEEREREGKQRVRRDNAADQSLNTHVLNGLFPANLIEKRLEKLDTTIKRLVGEFERRLVIAAFILHDFEKFPGMPKDTRKLSLEEHRELVDEKIKQLGIDFFLDSADPEMYKAYIDDLLCMAYNAQRRFDTNWNFSAYGLRLKLQERLIRQLSDLTCLADSLASIVKHPHDAENRRLGELIHGLSDGKLKFTYHAISENRGVLTNVLNNALVDAHCGLNISADEPYYTPLLYLPTGVIYLATKDAPPVSVDDIPERVVEKIKSLCAGQLKARQTGFGRDGKGMKYADYYQLFFDDPSLMGVGLNATLRILDTAKGKNSVAGERSANLVRFQNQNVLPTQYDFNFSADGRIDQLAEFGDLVTRKIWDERVAKIEAFRKQNKQYPAPPALDLLEAIVSFWGMEAYLPAIRQIERINESLRENNLKGNTGGVPYEWYFLAARYLETHPGIEDIRPLCAAMIAHIATLIAPIVAQYPLPDGWDDLRTWTSLVVMLPEKVHGQSIRTLSGTFQKELDNYLAAKKPGRGRQLICSISHSAYSVTEQMESAVLFTPQVYTNKQMLGGSNAKRNISSIAGIEMMLRQILMNQTNAVGKRFEDGKYRYLYFYPTYYFTPETNKFLQKAYSNIAQTRFDAKIRKHFIGDNQTADFSQKNYQSVDAFLIDENLDHDKDRTFKLSYPEDQPLTFFFIALPPGRDPTDTESWIMPTWLAFAFPILLDVKTVVSESPIPPFIDGSEFEESVFLDSAPQAFRILTGSDRFRLDYILEGWTENGIKHPSPLNVLTAAYSIHMDVNTKQGSGGYDPNWGRFTELAKDFETSPLYVFSYLKRFARNQGIESPYLMKIKLYAYAFYPCFDPNAQYNPSTENFDVNSQSPLNHPQKLTELFRKFYRASGKPYSLKANAILKPLDEAAQVVLKADPSFDLVTAVAAKINKLMDRVHSGNAEGRWVFKNIERDQEREAILDFARYFVVDVFEVSFASNRARLDGRQLNLLKDTCEFLYRLADDKENRERAENQPPEDVQESEPTLLEK
jgi:CRISPR-associated protein Csc3